jgi:hypothetical protein
MARAIAGCFGLVLGALVGAALALGAGLVWINVFETSCFEGYCGMLVFFTFLPIGAILGGLVGAIASVWLARPGPRDLGSGEEEAARPP